MEIPSATLLTPAPLLADAQPTLGPMTQKQGKLCARLRQLGFKLGEPMKLYGEQYELLGDPIVSGDNSVFVAAVNKKSGRLRSLRIPLLVVKMAMESVSKRERIEKQGSEWMSLSRKMKRAATSLVLSSRRALVPAITSKK